MAEKIFYHNNTKIRSHGRLYLSLFLLLLLLFLLLIPRSCDRGANEQLAYPPYKRELESPPCSLNVASFPRKNSKVVDTWYVADAIGSRDYQKSY